MSKFKEYYRVAVDDHRRRSEICEAKAKLLGEQYDAGVIDRDQYLDRMENNLICFVRINGGQW